MFTEADGAPTGVIACGAEPACGVSAGVPTGLTEPVVLVGGDFCETVPVYCYYTLVYFERLTPAAAVAGGGAMGADVVTSLFTMGLFAETTSLVFLPTHIVPTV